MYRLVFAKESTLPLRTVSKIFLKMFGNIKILHTESLGHIKKLYGINMILFYWPVKLYSWMSYKYIFLLPGIIALLQEFSPPPALHPEVNKICLVHYIVLFIHYNFFPDNISIYVKGLNIWKCWEKKNTRLIQHRSKTIRYYDWTIEIFVDKHSFAVCDNK